MKQTIHYLLLFTVGVVAAITGVLPEALQDDRISKGILYLLLFLVGIQIGSGRNMFRVLGRYGIKIMLLPLATTLGTFAGVSIISLLLPDRSLTDCLSVGAGFAYYSLNSKGQSWGRWHSWRTYCVSSAFLFLLPGWYDISDRWHPSQREVPPPWTPPCPSSPATPVNHMSW
jgi:hypothetical protein